MHPRKLTTRGRLLIGACAVYGVDRVSKWLVVELLDLEHYGRIEVVPPFLNFVMAWNKGINFGIAAGGSEVMRWILVLVAITVSAALVWWVLRRDARADADAAKRRVVPLAWGAAIVVGGALGNAWDRVRYGAVADFLNMSCCGIVNPYAFNIADVAIFAGAALIALKA